MVGNFRVLKNKKKHIKYQIFGSPRWLSDSHGFFCLVTKSCLTLCDSV